jgi:hypothetical protein
MTGFELNAEILWFVANNRDVKPAELASSGAVFQTSYRKSKCHQS